MMYLKHNTCMILAYDIKLLKYYYRMLYKKKKQICYEITLLIFTTICFIVLFDKECISLFFEKYYCLRKII